MKSKKLPKKKSTEFDIFEKAKKAGSRAPKPKRAKKPSIYDDDLEMDDFILNDQDFQDFNDYDDEPYY